MRPGNAVRLVLALVVTTLACGTPRASERDEPERRRSGSEREPFAAPADFKPVAFRARVSGHGRPVIFIPGLGCPGEVWDDFVEHLGDDYESHVLTLSGFAGRDAISEPLSAAVRRDLTRYIRSRHL